MLNLNFWACSILWSSGLYCLLLPRAALCLWHCVRTLSPPLGVIPPPNQTWGLTLLFSYLSCLCSTNSQVLVSVQELTSVQTDPKKETPWMILQGGQGVSFSGYDGIWFCRLLADVEHSSNWQSWANFPAQTPQLQCHNFHQFCYQDCI